jgi:predicted Zn-dependent protease
MKRSWLLRCLIGALAAAAVSTSAAQPAAKSDGVKVDEPSILRKLVPAEKLEQAAAQQYAQMKRDAAAKRALAPDNHPQVIRLRAIADRIIRHAPRFNPDATKWQWEVNLIGSKQINAFCMPGGKIAFYTGILETLQLTDDEVGIVMGHEVAHALREHARERIAKNEATRLGAAVVGSLIGGGRYADAFNLGGSLLTLKFSRGDETDADVVGLDLAARAGFDPRAGVTLWQKMAAASKNAPPQFLSTHPSGPNRIKEIQKHLPQVMPLYERAKGQSGVPTPPAPAPRPR